MPQKHLIAAQKNGSSGNADGQNIPTVAVCICSCQRPAGLSRLLDGLEQLDWNGDLLVFVVDNDDAKAAISVCKQRAPDYRWALQWAFEPRRGISFARNHVISLALEHDPAFIAMLDDDEWPSRQWLSALLQVQQKTGADVVGGPVLPVFPEPTERWVAHAADCYGTNQNLADAAECMLYGSGNFIARSRCFRALAPEYFRLEFACSGGEDFAFFRQLREFGFRLHWSSQAIVHETVPQCRLTLDWVRDREILKGNIQVRLFRVFDPGLPNEALRWAKTTALIGSGALKYLLGLFHGPTRIRAAMTLWRAKGKLQAHFGRTLERPDKIEGA